VFGFTNPTLITIMSIWRGEKLKKPEVHDWLCFGFGVVSLLVWWFVRQSLDLSQYALYLAIVADLCAAIPTLIFFIKEPEGDRPFAWFLFAVGYFVAIFAIKEQTFANYVLPLYMTVGSLIATLFLVIPRIRRRVGLKEWI
jgi:drug/metabolite transporter (DMT)-like permease